MSSIAMKTVTVCGQNYTVKFPNVGQFVDIKVLEVQLSQGQFKNMVLGSGEQNDAALYISTYAHLSVLCPDIFKDLKANSAFELSLIDFEDLVKVYLNEVQPWIQEVKKTLREQVAKRNESKSEK